MSAQYIKPAYTRRIPSNRKSLDSAPHFTTNTEQHQRRRASAPRNKHNTAPFANRTVKYLTVCNSPQAYRAVLRGAPDGVIKAIANAAYDVERGPIYLSPQQKALFRTHRRAIATLTSPKASIKSKRRVIQSQKGGFPFLPIMIGSALGALGSRLFGGQQQQ